jgi:hypothetical protein
VRIRHLLAVVPIAAAVGLMGRAAVADPSGSPGAFTGTAMCNGSTYPFVVNSGNGRGQGVQDRNVAEWVPAHIVGSQMVFHPTAFDVTFTFTPVGGPSQSFTDTSTRPHQTGDTTCQVSGSQTDQQGNTFSLSGSVTGSFS